MQFARTPQTVAQGITHVEPATYAKRMQIMDATNMPKDLNGAHPFVLTNTQALSDFFAGAALRESFDQFKQDRIGRALPSVLVVRPVAPLFSARCCVIDECPRW